MDRPTLTTAVYMRRERVQGAMAKWQEWRWVLHDVVIQEGEVALGPRLMRQTDDEQIWLHAGFEVILYKDDAEGYYLNSSSPAPCWFVLWRMQEEPCNEQPFALAMPTMVSVSYHDAGRWLDAQETVEQVPAPAEIAQWMQSFAEEHMVIETKKRKRPESFKALQDRFGNPAKVSTDKKYGQ